MASVFSAVVNGDTGWLARAGAELVASLALLPQAVISGMVRISAAAPKVTRWVIVMATPKITAIISVFHELQCLFPSLYNMEYAAANTPKIQQKPRLHPQGAHGIRHAHRHGRVFYLDVFPQCGRQYFSARTSDDASHNFIFMRNTAAGVVANPTG
jgi:hypothetical protein